MTRDKKITFRVNELEAKLIEVNMAIEGFKDKSKYARFVHGLPIRINKKI